MLSFGEFDWIWPAPDSPKSGEEEILKKRDSADLELVDRLADQSQEAVDDALNGVRKLVEDEDNRKDSVDSRLVRMLTGTATTCTLLVAAAGFLSSQQPSRNGSWESTFIIVLALLLSYVVSQLGRAVWAAVKGMERRQYGILVVSTFIASGEEERSQRLRHELKETVENLHKARRANDDKVTWMAVSQRALLNAIVGILIAATLFLVAMFVRFGTEQHTTTQLSPAVAPVVGPTVTHSSSRSRPLATSISSTSGSFVRYSRTRWTVRRFPLT